MVGTRCPGFTVSDSELHCSIADQKGSKPIKHTSVKQVGIPGNNPKQRNQNMDAWLTSPVSIACRWNPLGSVAMEKVENLGSLPVAYDGWGGRSRGWRWCNARQENKSQVPTVSLRHNSLWRMYFRPLMNNWAEHDGFEVVNASGASKRREVSAHVEMGHRPCSTANSHTRLVNPSLDETEDKKIRKIDEMWGKQMLGKQCEARGR